MKRTIWGLENKEDCIAATFPKAEGLREPSAECVEPVRHVAFTSIVVPDIDGGLICRRVAYITHLEPQKLMVKGPFDAKGICGRAGSNGTYHGPCAGQLLEKGVLKGTLRSIERRAEGREDEVWGRDEGGAKKHEVDADDANAGSRSVHANVPPGAQAFG